MSDSSKQQRIKNPLLSASVTGLTFDDFPNKPLLLPPLLPPIVHAPPVAVVTPSSLLAREPKSLVTVGSSSLDTENLDEINLNSSNEDSQSSEVTDRNANPLLEQSNLGTTNDSILSQAASSFSALPSVASNVFSTFSKRITAISSRETTPSNDQFQQDTNANTFVPQLDIQPTYTQQQPQQQSANLTQAPPPPFYAPPQGGSYFASAPQQSAQAEIQNNLPPIEPPKFYTPGDVPSLTAGSAVPPSNLGGQNNFRLTAKKKLYAPIPGFSDQSQPPTATLNPSAVSPPISYDSSTYSAYTSNDPYQQLTGIQQFPTDPQTKPEERNLASGLFSKISNFAPTGVFQNITGLVQSAAGSITQTIKPDSSQNFNQQQTPTGITFDQPSNYFAGPPPPTNFFVPPHFGGQEQANLQTTATSVEYSNNSLTQPPVSAVPFYNTQPTSGFNLSGPPTQSDKQSAIQPTSSGVNFFDPSQPPSLVQPPIQIEATIPPSQSASISQPANILNTQAPTPALGTSSADPLITSQTQLPFFNPSNLPPQVNPAAQAYRPNRPPSRPPSHPSSSYCPQANVTANDQEAVSFFNPTQSTHNNQPTEVPLNVGPQVVLFDPTKYLPTTSGSVPQAGLTAPPPPFNQSQLPPTGDSALPPPAGGHTSYRLQKGTKLYKNPLTPQETAPIQVTPLAPTVYQTFAPQSSFESAPFTPISNLNRFPPNQEVGLITDANLFHTVVHSEHKSVPLFQTYEPNQSVALFAAPLEDNKPETFTVNEPNQNIPLFAAPSEETKPAAPSTIELQTENIIENTIAEQQVNPEPLEEDNSSSLFFKPIEPEKDVLSEPTQTTDCISSFNNNEESQPLLQPIEPVIEEKSIAVNTETNPPKDELKLEKSVEDSLDQTLQKLSLTSEASTEPKILTLPPPTNQGHTTNNPYRRGSISETVKPAAAQPTLANFFTPGPSKSGSGDLNFFATLAATEPDSTSTNTGINFFSAPTKEKDNTKATTETGSFLTEATSHTQSASFFATPQAETIPENKPDLIPVIQQIPTTALFPPLPTNIDVIPSVLENKEDISKNFNESVLQANVPPPIGFDNFIQQIQPTAVTIVPENTTIQQEITTNPPKQQQPEIVNRFSNFFNQTPAQPEIPKDPSAFFDSFAGPQTQSQPQQIEPSVPTVVANEEQRIQYFFNNPPPKDAGAAGDLNYDLVHSGLAIKNLQQRSLTPVSNLVEPPSSACSEFSELSNSTAGQKSITADLSLTENIEKSIVEEEIKVVDIALPPSTEDISTVDSNIKHYEELPEEILKELRMANLLSGDKSATTASVSYKPVVKHWFYKSTLGVKIIWMPFSHYDSALLETSLLMEGDDKPNIVPVEGGRYDVNISERKKMSVYWESEPIEVRRCSWFYKAVDSKNVPYEEQTADVLESEYKQAAESGVWHKTIILGMGEQVVFHGPTVIVHFQQQQNTDAWGGTTQTSTRPRVVKRDLDDFSIEQGESQRVDHLLFMVHGIGSACDLKLRSVEEVVEDFRTIARQLVQSHYKNSTDLGLVGRVEVLPISWHSHLHSVEMGIDEKLRMITLESIPKLRNFTNDTLLDILFYTSPTFCQKIMNTIVSSMNGMYMKYRERHPEFNGGASLAGHSLGSIILFDLLCHQNPIKESEEKNLENPDQQFLTGSSSLTTTQMDSNQLEANQTGYTMGPAGTGQPFINYGQLIFQPKKFFALGSPIGMFVTIRGIDTLGLDFRLPTCPGFYNIFHPYDPVAYRIEALVNTDLSGVRPVLIPHHKGRKRMHLELKETMTRVSMDLKQRFFDKFKTTIDSVNIFGTTTKSTKEAEELMEKEVEKVIQMQMQLERQDQPSSTQSQNKLSPGNDTQNPSSTSLRQRTDSVSTVLSDDMIEIDLPLGKLNDSKRIDYVLQEAPLEFFNEYIFALSSHVCYWDSEDTILFVMKEIYSGLGISPDSQVPQQTMTIERPSSRNSLLSTS